MPNKDVQVINLEQQYIAFVVELYFYVDCTAHDININKVLFVDETARHCMKDAMQSNRHMLFPLKSQALVGFLYEMTDRSRAYHSRQAGSWQHELHLLG